MIKNGIKSKSKLKKEVWKLFSRYIRLRDALATTHTKDAFKCISCGKLVKVKEGDAGHFISRRFNSTLFNEKNVNAQCKYDNKTNQFLAYRRGLIKKYGGGIDIELEETAKELKKWTIPELLELKEYYQNKIKELGG